MKSGALKILTTLREHGFAAFLVGGCVRDFVLETSSEDYDIVTNAAPPQVKELFKYTIPVGVQFGISIVVMKGKKYEVAQFRRGNSAPPPLTDLPSILREDSRHRDFTINSMFYDPFSDEIFDYQGGRRDIQQRVIRAIEHPQARFDEDYLRMMRAVRFAAAYDFQIDPATNAAMRQSAAAITSVSVERIRDELIKILLTARPDQGIRLLDDIGLLRYILPEASALKGIPQPKEFHPEGDVFAHTLLMLHHLNKPSPELAMGVLLHDIGKPATFTHTDRIRFHDHARIGAEITETICARLKFSTKSTEKIVTLVREHLKFFDAEQMKNSTLKRFLRQEYFPDLLELHRLDCVGSDGNLHTYELCRAKLQEFREHVMRPPRLLSGDDLIGLGLTPGPVFSQVLEYLEDAQLEGIIFTRKQARDFVRDFQSALPQDL